MHYNAFFIQKIGGVHREETLKKAGAPYEKVGFANILCATMFNFIITGNKEIRIYCAFQQIVPKKRKK